ncbi:MAG TPA: tetratricopeptide repeat protein [Albitalea sp.]|nr:tetratricopeptide repeat protein [Albitalea sp.]
MKTWGLVLACTLLAACASAPTPVPPPERLFDDALFAPAGERISADDVFALSEPMRRFLKNELVGEVRSKGLQQGLVDALQHRGKLRLEYDSSTTRTASQAFEARSGNCLSLVLMTAALAKELGLPVHYQSVFVDTTWSRSGDLYFSSGHINLTLGARLLDSRMGYGATPPLTIDFLPPEELRGQRSRSIGEDTVIAMYMNNHAAELLSRGRLDDAYWWARQAIVQSPTFMSAYNTLGVIYLRHGNVREAEQSLRSLLEREPANTAAMSNLARVLETMGRTAEAQEWTRKLAQIEAYPPFHFFDRGIAAMLAGDYKTARDLFKKEIDRAAYYHEFHFWLAIAESRLGDVKEARRHLAIAIENSTTRSDHDLYAAKLDWLKAHRVQ